MSPFTCRIVFYLTALTLLIKSKSPLVLPVLTLPTPTRLKHSEGNIGGATDVGVRLVKSDNTNVTLGTPITINFPTTNSYQELNFKARMESLGRTATPGNVQAQANYVLDYK